MCPAPATHAASGNVNDGRDVKGEGLQTLLAIRKVTGPGGISVSQSIVDLGEGRLPIALEPLETSQGPTGYFTMVRTRFIDVSSKPAAARSEVTNTKMTYAQTSLHTTAKVLNRQAAGAESEENPAWKRVFTSNFGFLIGGIVVVLVVSMNVNNTRKLLTSGKSAILQGAMGKAIAEKAAKLDAKIDAEIKSTGAAITRPIDLAKKAAEQAGAVPQELFDLAPEIKREDVIGKPRTAAAAPVPEAQPENAAAPNAPGGAAGAPVGGAGVAAAQGSISGESTSATGVTVVARREVASPVPRENAPSPVEDAIFASCMSDGEFCHRNGLIYLKDGAATSALRFFNQGCELGHVKSCSQAAALYQSGQGVEHSETKAKALLIKACTKNDGSSCTEVGLAYLQGAGLPISLPRAREAIDRGCVLGYGPACVLLGLAAQNPPDGVQVSKASSAESLAKGCTLLNIVGCAPPGSQKH